MSEKTRSLDGWHTLMIERAKIGELSYEDALLLCVMDIRNYTLSSAQDGQAARAAAEHTEGMLGALDDLASTVTANLGIPYARSGVERAALERARRQLRELPDAATSNGSAP